MHITASGLKVMNIIPLILTKEKSTVFSFIFSACNNLLPKELKKLFLQLKCPRSLNELTCCTITFSISCYQHLQLFFPDTLRRVKITRLLTQLPLTGGGDNVAAVLQERADRR